MRIVQFLILGLVAMVVVFFAGAALIPGTAVIEREVLIERTPAEVYAIVNDYRQFPKWSPWNELDPNMQVTMSANPVGAGAKYSWVGNDKAGTGVMTNTGGEPNASVAQRVEFQAPFQSVSLDTMYLQPAGAGTRVRWVFHNELDYPMNRWFYWMIQDGVGNDYTQGLQNLKRLVESQPAATDTTAGSAPVAGN